MKNYGANHYGENLCEEVLKNYIGVNYFKEVSLIGLRGDREYLRFDFLIILPNNKCFLLELDEKENDYHSNNCRNDIKKNYYCQFTNKCTLYRIKYSREGIKNSRNYKEEVEGYIHQILAYEILSLPITSNSIERVSNYDNNITDFSKLIMQNRFKDIYTVNGICNETGQAFKCRVNGIIGVLKIFNIAKEISVKIN